MVGVTFKKRQKIFQGIKKTTSITADGQKIRFKSIFVLLIVSSCFLLLVRAFDKLPAFKTGKEKRATSP